MDTKKIATIFKSTLLISAFTFGGGYVIVPMLKKRFSDELKWIEENEIMDLTAAAQTAPGPIAVNASILIGFRTAGAPGAMAAVAGTVIPPLVTLSIITVLYGSIRDNPFASALLKGFQAGAAAVIADAVFSICSASAKTNKAYSYAVMAAAFACSFAIKANIAQILAAAGTSGLLIRNGKDKGKEKRE